ncbi:MAG: GNAT family N-acetyltransferase [Lutibacter sp.]
MNPSKTSTLLNTKRLTLTHLKDSDLKLLFEIRSNPKVLKFVEKDADKNYSDTKKFIETINSGIKQNKWYYWGIYLKRSHQLIGTICLWNFNQSKSKAEIGFELHPSFWKKGYLSESIIPVLQFGFNQLNLNKILAFTHKNNSNAINLLLRNSFEEKDISKNNIIFSLSKISFSHTTS